MTNALDTVPETDQEHPVTSDTPSAPAAPANSAPAPVAPVVVPAAPAPRTGNAAWASEEDRKVIADLHAAIRAVGYTRPMVSAVTGFNDSTVWRAQNHKAFTIELDAWLAYFKALPRDDDGNFLPAPGSKQAKPKIEDVQRELDQVKADYQAKIDAAVAALSTEDAKSIKQLREVVQTARDALLGTPVEAPAEVVATA